MIENTKYKNFKQQIDSYRAAVYAFQDRYKALPGDFANTNGELTAPAGVTLQTGDNNGQIAGTWCNVANEESCAVWQHLILSGLISGNPATVDGTIAPTHAYGGLFSSIASVNFSGATRTRVMINPIPGDIAQRLDTDIDDGNPASGDVVRSNGTAYGTGNVAVFVNL